MTMYAGCFIYIHHLYIPEYYILYEFIVIVYIYSADSNDLFLYISNERMLLL